MCSVVVEIGVPSVDLPAVAELDNHTENLIMKRKENQQSSRGTSPLANASSFLFSPLFSPLPSLSSHPTIRAKRR